jgi:cell wall-associated NlpC family hydrolase
MDGVDNCWDATVAKASSTTTAPTGNIAQVAQTMGGWGGQYQACYLTGGGHGTLDDLKQRIANHFANVNGVNYGVDCSGFTRAVIYTATGKDPGGLSTSAMCASPEYEHIPRAQAQPGDLAIRCDTHVEVITDVNGGKFKTVGSHTSGCGPSYGPSPGTEQGNSSFVLRFKG